MHDQGSCLLFLFTTATGGRERNLHVQKANQSE